MLLSFIKVNKAGKNNLNNLLILINIAKEYY